MHTLIILLSCFGFFMLYNTSKRAKLSAAGRLEQLLQRYPRNAKRTGVLLVLISMVAFVYLDGLGVGLFAGVLLLMASAAYIVAIAPLYYLRFKHIAVVALSSLFLELFIF